MYSEVKIKKEFFAHSENPKGKKHLLIDHLLSTANFTKSFAPKKEFQSLFYLSGIFHDIGKYQNGFQKYLEFGKPKTPHATIGAFIARQLIKHYFPLPFVIKGHHAGLPDKDELSSAFVLIEDDVNSISEVEQQMRVDFPDLEKFISISESLVVSDKTQADCITRILFSSLTDADWLDTEHHFKQELTDARISSTLDYDNLINALEKKFLGLPKDGQLNKLRTNARTEIAAYYSLPIGFFSLQLPTGLGKTLTSVYWALLHAKYHKLKRIIIVLPYINIIDQTAKILKGIFGEDVIVEHHSGVAEEDKGNSYDELSIRYDKNKNLSKRLACENWDAPIIITTSVQFFESLFSNRPFRCRKNHNISESVVIFDEVQTLPKQYSEPIVVMLKNINQLAKTSFLFCTATQPAFVKREEFDGIEFIQPLVEEPEKYFKPTQRVNYKQINKLNEVSLDKLTDNLKKETESFLVIVNTKSVAVELYKRVSQMKKLDKYYHLSTAMCPHHRKKTIENIITDLQPESGKHLAVISTQLVEAGVDFDFPCVYRAIAPLDAVIQAAGRCNRNNRLKKGRVILFNLENHKMPDSTYKSAADLALRMIKDNPEILHDANSFEQYYEEFTNLYVETDKYNITENRKKGNFKTVAENFKLIDPTTSLFIKDYSDESKELFKEIEKSLFISKEHFRKLQQYSVQVYRSFLMKYSNQIENFKDLFYIWYGSYDERTGITPKDINTVF